MKIHDTAQLIVQNTLLEMVAVAVLARADDPKRAITAFAHELGAKVKLRGRAYENQAAGQEEL